MHDRGYGDLFVQTTHWAMGTVMTHQALGLADTISGATLTSKAHLQCVGNPLLQAQGE